MQAVEEKKQRSPWLYVGIGCAVLLLLGLGAAVAGVSFLFKQGKQYQEDMASPITRAERVKETLGAQTLPEGYHAAMSLSVPALLDTAILTTRSPDEPPGGQQEGARVFLYFFLKASSVKDQEELRRYLEGQSEDTTVLARNNIRVGENELIGRGAIELEGRRVLYLAQRGELKTQHGEDERPDSLLNSILFIECPGQRRMRLGLWMAPDPDPSASLEQLELTGTPVDPEAIRAFMSHLNPCPES